jgi:lysozyme
VDNPQLPNGLLEFIKHWEGCRLKAYTDQGGRVTIGWGHTGGVQLGNEWSQEQADEQLSTDLGGVLEKVRSLVRVPTTDNQLAALTSFSYNLGPLNLARSGLLRYLNLRKYANAAEQFLLWNHIGMYVSPGLTARREAERALFLKEANIV